MQKEKNYEVHQKKNRKNERHMSEGVKNVIVIICNLEVGIVKSEQRLQESRRQQC